MLDEFVALDCVSAVSQAASSGSVISSTWSDERRYGGQLTELLLHEELLDFWSAFQPTEAELSTRRLLVERVTALSKMVWPHSILHPFGSYSTGIQLPTSDIDLVVVGTGHVHKSTGGGLEGEGDVSSTRGVSSRECLMQASHALLIHLGSLT